MPFDAAPMPFAGPDYVPANIQNPASWAYDIDPATGVSRATYNGEVFGQTASLSATGTQFATLDWVTGKVAAISSGVTSFNTRSGAVTLSLADVTGAGGAPLNNAGLTGTTSAQTLNVSNNASVGGNASITGTVTGTAGVTAGGGVLNVTGAAGTYRALSFQTAGSPRWVVFADGSAETGGAAGTGGSTFGLNAYDNSGNYKGTPLTIDRTSFLLNYAGAATFGGSVTAANQAIVNGAAGTTRQVQLGTGSVARWQLIANAVAESGGNAGSDFVLLPSADNGSPLAAALTVTRATGAAQFSGSVSVGNGQPITTAGTMICGHLAAGTNQGASANGGMVGSWQVANNKYVGLCSDQSGGMMLGAGDAGTGVFSSWWGTLSATQFQIAMSAAYKPGGGSWADSSDIRIKQEQGAYASGLAEVMELRPVRYSFLGNDGAPGSLHPGHDPGPVYVGLIAQEAETVMPELVSRRSGWIDGRAVDDLRTLDPGPLVFALVNAVRELGQQVAALGERMAALEAGSGPHPDQHGESGHGPRRR